MIVGGGSAGWLTAGIIAAEHASNHSSTQASAVNITLIESANVPIVGVGEGTWPSMRNTLKKMGISETDFLLSCDASFKQGSKFSNWQTNTNEHYYHPFTQPAGFNDINLSSYWQPFRENVSFADAVCEQSHLGRNGLAPKQISTPEYAFNANYGYHLDAGKFSVFLKKHCTEKLNVNHIIDHVTAINSAPNNDIASITTQTHGEIEGDLFIDCTGSSALLIGKHYNIPFKSKKHILFNDSALAVHVPYPEIDSPIASFTSSSAQTAGWIWDIGLPSRRGVGYTYSSAHSSDASAEQTLRQYIMPDLGKAKAEAAEIRKLSINPGHREVFWHKNCVAIGMSAGFIEPLEASALVLIELSAKMLCEQLPANRITMDIISKRFNAKFTHRWENIIDFLKLHYVLSQRNDSDYWLENRNESTMTASLIEQLELWKYQAPYKFDAIYTEEMFPAASFQYILYGMGFVTEPLRPKRENNTPLAEKLFSENVQKVNQLVSTLPSNRALLDKIKHYGLQKI